MKVAHQILVVDRNRRNLELLRQFLGKEGYQVLTATTPEEFDQALTASGGVGLVLLDIAGFDRTIWERCEVLRAKSIPFLVLSPRQSTALQQTSFSHGARGLLVKPLVVKELLGIIHSLLEEDG